METTIIKVTINNYDNYLEAFEHMESQNVKHLGWLNSGIKVPEHYKFTEVFSNWSGSSCLYCDPIHRVSYSVDMGD